MLNVMSQIKKATIDGFFTLLPVIIILLILEETFSLIYEVVEPLGNQLPGKEILGIGLSSWLVLFLILASFMLVGFVSYTKPGRYMGKWFGDNVMRHFPGYQILKSISKQFSGKGEDILLSSAVFETDMGTWMFAFILDEHDNGYYSLFVPMAPTPMMGTMQYVKKTRVKKLDVAPSVIIDNLMKWGIGSKTEIDPLINIGR